MDELRRFVESLTPGTRVRVTGYEANGHGGMATVQRTDAEAVHFRLDRPVRSQGMSWITSYLPWALLEDYELEDRTLRVYNPSHAYNGGRRTLSKTFEFLGEPGE